MTCKKAQGFLESHAISVKDLIDAGKEKQGRDEALTLAKSADKIVIAKGKNTVTFDMKKDKPDDDTLAAGLLGPTGNLRAPSMRVGKTLFVGFNKEALEGILG